MKSNNGTGLGLALEIARARHSPAGRRAIERLRWVLCVAFDDVLAAERAFEAAYDALVADLEQGDGGFAVASSALEDVYDHWAGCGDGQVRGKLGEPGSGVIASGKGRLGTSRTASGPAPSFPSVPAKR